MHILQSLLPSNHGFVAIQVFRVVQVFGGGVGGGFGFNVHKHISTVR